MFLPNSDFKTEKKSEGTEYQLLDPLNIKTTLYVYDSCKEMCNYIVLGVTNPDMRQLDMNKTLS